VATRRHARLALEVTRAQSHRLHKVRGNSVVRARATVRARAHSAQMQALWRVRLQVKLTCSASPHAVCATRKLLAACTWRSKKGLVSKKQQQQKRAQVVILGLQRAWWRAVRFIPRPLSLGLLEALACNAAHLLCRIQRVVRFRQECRWHGTVRVCNLACRDGDGGPHVRKAMRPVV
jgi:hypothetical protein